MSPAILEQQVENLKLELRNEKRDHQATRDQLVLRDTRIRQLEEQSRRLAARIDELGAKA